MKISLRQLTYFVALSETQSFGVAAARVNISQPALSQQIKELETVLGVQLIERLPREARLTRAGNEVLTRARSILADVHDLEQAVRWQDGLTGRLRLGVIPTVAPYILADVLGGLRRAQPQLDIRVHEAQTERLIERVVSGQLDAAVMALPVADKRLVATEVCQDRFLLAGTPARIDALMGQAERLRPKELDPDQLLLLDEGHCLADQALEVCGLGRDHHIDLGASSLSTLCGLVSGGFGLTFLPELAVKAEMAGGSLSLLRFSEPEPYRSLAVVRRATSSDEGWMDQLCDHVADACLAQISYARDIIAPATPDRLVLN